MRAYTLAGTAAIALMASSVMAQTAATATAATAEESLEIIVTAQKRSERLQDVPLAVSVISGDALVEIPKLSGAFDFVFCDAWKRDYQKYFTLSFPLLNKGGLFLAHNVVNKKNEMTDFLTAVQTDPRMFTSIVTPSGEGVSVTVKAR